MRNLTRKQELFIKEYLVDLNATAAAKRAKYSLKTAEAIGAENLKKPMILGRIQEAFQKRSERTEVTQDMVIAELSKIAFGDQREIARWDQEGNVRITPSSDISDDAAASISEIRQSVTSVGISFKVKKYDKTKALELLGKHLGMFVERHEHAGKDGGPIELDTDPKNKLKTIISQIAGRQIEEKNESTS